ncbi:MAG: DUF3179 domain-containing protein [Thermoplasmata archaeon]
MRVWLSAVIMGFFVLLASTPAAAEHVDTGELFEVLPWDTLHTITEPRFDDARYVGLREEVFGVVIGGEAHTYPVKLMHYHEVIDDVVGGIPIVVSYCPLCGVALAYERTVDGDVLTFRTSGLLYRNNKVMFDVETESLWPLLLGEAINGTYHGTRLVRVPIVRLPLGDWLSLHPNAQIVARPWGPVLCPAPCILPSGFQGYDVNPYANYTMRNETLGPVINPDTRLHPKTFVVGVIRGDETWAFGFPDLLEQRAINFVLGGLPIVVALRVDPAPSFVPVTSAHVYERGNQALDVDPESNELVGEGGERFSILTGAGSDGELTPVPFFYGFWFAWKDFHPDTCLYGFECVGFALHIWVPYLSLVGGALLVAGFALWKRVRK